MSDKFRFSHYLFKGGGHFGLTPRSQERQCFLPVAKVRNASAAKTSLLHYRVAFMHHGVSELIMSQSFTPMLGPKSLT